MAGSARRYLCPVCRQGHLRAITRTEVFRPHGVDVAVELLASRCDVCSAETTRASQHDDNLRRLAARKVHYGGLLMGEEIVALRKRHGLTQQAASRIFSKGKIAFSRYENEVTYPDGSTTLLLTLAIEKPECLKWLADKAGVEVPMGLPEHDRTAPSSEAEASASRATQKARQAKQRGLPEAESRTPRRAKRWIAPALRPPRG